jgi:ATP-dependent DNA ligase
MTLVPPIDPMLAKLSKEVPVGDGWIYEPKWDGFRALVFKSGDRLQLISRDQRDLVRYFPEVHSLLARDLPETCVIDGEVLLATASGLDFEALLQRIHPAESRVKMLAETTPSGFAAFDVLELAHDLTGESFARRHSALVDALGEERVPPSPREIFDGLGEDPNTLWITPQTDSADEARDWMETFEAQGLDGIVAKRLEDVYQPGKRVMVKVKRERTIDCVVGGYRTSKSGAAVGSLLLGLYGPDGTLHYVGHTSSFKVAERRELLTRLQPLEGGVSFEGGRAPGGPSRWTGGRDTTYVPLEPSLVCEVAFDRMLGGHRFRHSARFLRWRPDKPPSECTFDQL